MLRLFCFYPRTKRY